MPVTTVNDVCPIRGGEVDPEGELASFDGNTVGFCCNGCRAEWNALSHADKLDFVTEAMAQ